MVNTAFQANEDENIKFSLPSYFPFQRKLLSTVLPNPYKLERERQLKVSPDVKLCPRAKEKFTQTTTSPFQRK